jgi:hypothetical protein
MSKPYMIDQMAQMGTLSCIQLHHQVSMVIMTLMLEVLKLEVLPRLLREGEQKLADLLNLKWLGVPAVAEFEIHAYFKCLWWLFNSCKLRQNTVRFLIKLLEHGVLMVRLMQAANTEKPTLFGE